MSRDWTLLNWDLLHLILQKLENFSNFIRFRSICKNWRSAIGPTEYFPHLPWILYPADASTYYIYSLSSNTSCQIKLPRNQIECEEYLTNDETVSGFLLLKDNVSKIQYMFNPLTETKLYPPLSMDNSIYFTIYNMILDPNGTSRTAKGGFHLMFCELLIHKIEECKKQVKLWKYDNNEFTNFRIPLLSKTAAYYKGMLFVYSHMITKTSIFDMNTGAEVGTGIQGTVGGLHRNYLVVAMEDLLRVKVTNNIASRRPCDFKFCVYRLEHTSNFEQCKWKRLKGIGDRILFFGIHRYSISAFCLSTTAINGLEGNCIYYLHNYHVLRYNLEDHTTDHVSHVPAHGARWFMPSLS